MKAFTIDRYGDPEGVMKLSEVDQPVVRSTQVLVQVKATTINDYDWCAVTGTPREYRMLFGLRKPRFSIPGMEVAGVVEAVGSDVIDFKAGDRVYGDISEFGFGTFAEYVSVDQSAVVSMPTDMSFKNAVVIPHAGCLAYQGLIVQGGLRKGMKILINGAGGGVGTIGGQLAKYFDCEVTGVDHRKKLDLLRDYGFDQVIDYQKIDFAETGRSYDLILDCKSMRSGMECLRALKPKGKYVSIGGKTSSVLSVVTVGAIIRPFTEKRLSMLALKPNVSLAEVTQLVEDGVIKCAIDGPHDFSEIPRLVKYFGAGEHKGKIVIRV